MAAIEVHPLLKVLRGEEPVVRKLSRKSHVHDTGSAVFQNVSDAEEVDEVLVGGDDAG